MATATDAVFGAGVFGGRATAVSEYAGDVDDRPASREFVLALADQGDRRATPTGSRWHVPCLIQRR